MFSTEHLFFIYGKINNKMFEKISNLFKFKAKKFLGIDIGTSSVRVVEISRKGNNYKLENYGEIKTSLVKEKKPFITQEKNTFILSDDNVAKAIKTICQEAEIKTREANFSIPDFCSFFTSFEVPTMGADELSEAIKYEVRPYIPLPISEITLDWSVISGEVSKTPLKILAVAIPNDVINQYKKIALASGLELKLLESEVSALVRIAVGNEEKEKIIGLLDLGSRSTTFSIVEKGILKISHSFSVGGNELTDSLSRSLNITYSEAETVKEKVGISGRNGKFKEIGKENIEKILFPLVDFIIREVKKSLRDYYQNEGKEVEKVVLSGGSALLPGLKEYFFSELKKEITIVNAFRNIEFPRALSDALKEKSPSYAIATGLALKGLE